MKKIIKFFLPAPIKEYLLEYNRRRFCSKLYITREFPNPGEYYSFNAFDYYKCIFIHIPKAAGVSVNTSLFGNYGGGHRYLKFYQEKYPKHTFKNYYKFTIVRNPWDRLFSAFTFLKKGGFDHIDADWAEQNLAEYKTFEDFVLNWVTTENVYKKIHFVPQFEFLLNKEGQIEMNYIGRFEEMENSFSIIAEKLDIKASLERKNVTRRITKYTDQYTPEMKRIVADVYQRDIKEFQYQF